MSEIKIITEWVDGTIEELDVDQNSSILLKKRLIDITDIDQRRGDFTQQFALPRTVDNDLFFGNWGDPSTIGGNWNSRLEAPAFILEDDNIIIQGVLKLESTNPQMDKYYVSISGNVATIKSILGELEMSALDMTPWTYQASQIYSTWSRSLFSGDMVFPIHDFGFGWGLYKKQGAANVLQDFTNSATPIILDQTIPCFRLTKLLELIFNEKDITVEGSFFTQPYVDDIYVQADTALQTFISGASLFNLNIIAPLIVNNAQRTISWGASPSIPDYNNTLYEYTAPANGAYYFDFSLTVTFPGIPASANGIIYFQKDTGGGYVNDGSGFTFNWNSNVSTTNYLMNLNAGDKVRMTIRMTTTITSNGQIIPGLGDYWNLANFVPTGTLIDPSAYWGNHRQIDFVRSVFQIFNIIAWFDPDGKLQLDHWDDYMINEGERKDWSEKVDYPSISVQPINGELRNPVNLSLQEANNVLNIDYHNVVGRPYGSYREDQSIPFTLPEAKAIESFSPACLQEIDPTNANGANYPQVIINKYYSDEDSIAYKSPGLQLMYYNGARTIPTAIYTSDSAGGATTARTNYPYFSNFKLFSASSYNVQADTLDLNFTYWTPPATGIVTAPSEQGLFNRYFREMIRERYDEGSKILKMNVLLDAADIQNFSFADTILVEINGTYVGLRIIEILDYSPNSERLTKVKAYITFVE